MTSDRTKRIAKNTLILYVQMFFGMLVGLYTSRVVLNELGVEDFGIYNVIGGVVMMFTMLNMSMSSSTSRFITFELGHNPLNVRYIFGSSLTIHFLLAILVILAGESIGIWFLQNKMQISADRIDAARWVFHCSIAGTFISIVNVPYSALIIAHERMSIYAYFSLLDIVLKLFIVLVLPYYSVDKLKLYAVLLLGVQVLIQLVHWLYCYIKFPESRIGFVWDKTHFRKMSTFAGWSLFGDSAVIMSTQGVNILLNIFFGAGVNAARGIAVQVQGVINRFINSFQTALNPQLVKSYASDDLAYMHRLIFISSKFSCFLFLIVAMPVFFETELLLTWWLKVVPEHTVSFIRIMIFTTMVDTLANPLIMAAKANGNIGKYQSVLGSLLLLIVPVSYMVLKLGYSPESVFIVHLGIVLIGQILRVYLIKDMIRLNVNEYVSKVIFPCLLVGFLAPILPLLVYLSVQQSFFRLFLITAISIIVICTVVFFFVLGDNERKFIRETILKKIKHT